MLTIGTTMVLGACSTQPMAGTTPQASLVATSPSPSAAACRLPVVVSDVDGTNTRPAFLSLSTGSIEFVTGGEGGIYDAPLGRWVVADRRGLAPNGLTYAYVDGDTTMSRVHLVDLLTGIDRVITSGGPWAIVGLRSDDLYLMKLVYGPPSPAFGSVSTPQGLWMMPLTGGAPRRLTSDHRSWSAVGTSAAWGSEFNAADPQPYGGDGGFAPNQIVRLDLATADVATWLYRPGFGAFVIGLYQSDIPFVAAQNGSVQELWALSSANPTEPLWSGAWGELGPSEPMVADSGIVWLSGFIPEPPYSPAIFRWTDTTGFQMVARFKDLRITVAGPCS